MNVIFKVYIFSQIFKKHELHELHYVCYGKSLTSNFFKQDDTAETYIKDRMTSACISNEENANMLQIHSEERAANCDKTSLVVK